MAVLNGLVEPLLLGVLVGEGLGGADAGQAGLDGGVDGTGLLLGSAGGGAHLFPAAQRRQQQHRQHHQQHQRQLPADAEHHDQRAHDGHKRDKQILRPVVGQLRHLEQVAGQAAHQLAGTVLVVEVKAQLLHMVVQVAADIRLHPDAEGVAPVGHHEVQPRANYIGCHHQRHHDEEHPELLFRQPRVQRGAGHQRKRQIHHGDEERAGHVQREQAPVGLEIGQEYPQQAAVLEIFRRHGHPRSALHIWLIIVPHFPRFCKCGRRAARVLPRRNFPLNLCAVYGIISPLCAGVMELVDVVDSKSTAGDSVPVRVRSPAPPKRDILPDVSFLLRFSLLAKVPQIGYNTHNKT